MATFGNLSSRLTDALKSLRGKGKLTEADVDGTLREIRRAMLDADVSLTVVKSFQSAVRERALSDDVNKALNPAQQVVQIVNDELVTILGGQQRRIEFAKKPPTVIMLAGLQGSGKTTLAGKLAKWLAKEKHTPLLVACDLQRPNAVTQLEVIAGNAGVAIFAPEPGNGKGNPVKVAKDSLKYATDKLYDVVIIDTAGRLGVDAELMKEASDIRKATSPDEVFFVIDAMIGQDAVATAEAFQQGVDFTGVVLTKLDGDARGGAALSVVSATERPIMFASTGESLDDFEPFYPDRMASRILDLGDILTLIEQAQQTFDADEQAKVAQKIATETFTLEDFLEQMQQLKNMGSLKKMMGMLPGSGQMKAQLDNFDESEITRTEAIIRSMTPAERRNSRLLNGSRRLRIAQGSGVTVTDVNSLVNRFDQAAKMMKTVAKGKVPQIPGMGPIPGAIGGSRPKATKKKTSRSGNPAKRAAENAAISQGGRVGSGAGFGLGAATGAADGGAGGVGDLSAEELADMQKLLGGR